MPEAPEMPTLPDTAPGWERLHHIVTHLVEATFTEPPQVITTDRTGKVDAAWLPDGDGGMRQVPLEPWLLATSDRNRHFNLSNLGGMLRLYAEHPERSSQITVKTYPEWPAMVEVRLSGQPAHP